MLSFAWQRNKATFSTLAKTLSSNLNSVSRVQRPCFSNATLMPLGEAEVESFRVLWKCSLLKEGTAPSFTCGYDLPSSLPVEGLLFSASFSTSHPWPLAQQKWKSVSGPFFRIKFWSWNAAQRLYVLKTLSTYCQVALGVDTHVPSQLSCLWRTASHSRGILPKASGSDVADPTSRP